MGTTASDPESEHMPWARVDDHAMGDPKIVALSDGAFRLWCEGLSYCQQYLTDGAISLAAMRKFKYFTPARYKQLTTVLVTGKGPCWDLGDDGVQVHDFLDWNDSKAVILQHRQDSRDRKEKWKEKHRERVPEQSQNAHGLTWSGSSSDLRSTDPRSSGSREVSAIGNPALADRAARLVDAYARYFADYRKGAKYHSKPSVDFQVALGLCATWTDDTRLNTLVIAFLTTDDPFCRNGAGSLAQFASRASWCDAKLKEAGL